MTATFSAIHHVTLSVTDLVASERFYSDVLGFTRLRAMEAPGMTRVLLRHASGVLVGLTVHEASAAGDAFDERRIGLDHLSFAVQDMAALEAWGAHLDALGVPHSEIKAAAATGAHLIAFRDPDNIQLEFFVVPPTA
jgi:catechol 2,3-dioxygenase-like lactoylglutathione lyase family enzyme